MSPISHNILTGEYLLYRGYRASNMRTSWEKKSFLEHSLRVPDLILPDKIFPKQRSVDNPPVIDFESLASGERDAVSKIADSVAYIGCFQVANHGISREIVRSVQAAAAAGIFTAAPEKRAAVTRSPEMAYGFEEAHGEEGESESEEFLWSRDEGLKSLMEGIWPLGYSNFCKQMEILLTNIEKVGEKVLSVFLKDPPKKSIDGNEMLWLQGHETGTLCCLYKNSRHVGSDIIGGGGGGGGGGDSLRHEVIRMLIRRNDHSHALCLHFCGGSSDFHVYSKKGWVSFTPEKDALVITIGDQMQTWSGGQYKHVIGRPIFKEEKEDCISMAFLYSPPSITRSSSRAGKSTITWEQVQNWFEDKHKKLHPESTSTLADKHKKLNPESASSPASLQLVVDLSDSNIPTDAPKSSQISSHVERKMDLHELAYEAKSVKDNAWYDVASFLSYRLFNACELEVRVRFSGFGKEEDEWVNVRTGVRERSIPLEPSECEKVKVGDLVLCFQACRIY
ncbi:hypothetical protein TIFTF001_006566 [Ficus carica]|uniref:Uncharacterized protein n=1 Tax=Ficus carica TaxID=3494 RepID=A0AA87ZJ81_FICCA|nr:hypothetical protein TIFTF001_006566 [Ficus carica]